MNEDFLRWVAEKSWPDRVCESVCVCVCVSKHFRAWRPNDWSDRDRGGTDGRTETPERLWCLSRVGRRHVARGTCRPVKVYQKFSRAPGAQTGAATEPKLAGHTRTVPT